MINTLRRSSRRGPQLEGFSMVPVFNAKKAAVETPKIFFEMDIWERKRRVDLNDIKYF